MKSIKTPNSVMEKSFLSMIYKQMKTTFQKRCKNIVISTTAITNRSDIPFSALFPPTSFDPQIASHIYTFSRFKTVVESCFDDDTNHEKILTIIFVAEKATRQIVFEQRLAQICFLMQFLQSFMKSELPKTTTVYIYLTSLKKQIPLSSNIVLGVREINTGMTIVKHNEIVIFREEEWFKVLIHESFHAFGLDFAGLNTDDIEDKLIKDMFYVKSKVLLSEAYAEFWANLLHTCIVCFWETRNMEEFNRLIKATIIKEKQFKIFQLQKVLNYMQMDYVDFFNKPHNSFSEKTNIFSYYILSGILIFYAESFIHFCSSVNNYSLLQSNHSVTYIHEFANFINSYCMDEKLLDAITEAGILLEKYKLDPKKKEILRTLRMTSIEI